MTKYKEYFQKMLADNKKLFDDFLILHNEYGMDQDGLQEKFNEQGKKVMEVVREYENRVCANTERGMYNKYSTNLAEKFQNEVRKHFPLIDHVGLVIQKFTLKKINL